MKSIIIFTVSLFLSAHVFAHALWIETAPFTQKGRIHAVNIFYGEYAEGKPDNVAEWYSDVKEFSLWLVTPDDKKIKLSVTAGEDRYTAQFTPEKEGYYQLLITHEAKDLGRTTKYQFNTSASVTVGKRNVKEIAENLNPLRFNVQGNKLHQPVLVYGIFKDLPSDKMSVTIFSPKGWIKTIKGNSQGIAQFIPEWPGTYMIEISRTDDEKGDHHGKAYEHVWRCATHLIEVQ